MKLCASIIIKTEIASVQPFLPSAFKSDHGFGYHVLGDELKGLSSVRVLAIGDA
jgi:hypothetical protein